MAKLTKNSKVINYTLDLSEDEAMLIKALIWRALGEGTEEYRIDQLILGIASALYGLDHKYQATSAKVTLVAGK